MHMIMNLARDKREANWLQLFAQGKNFACRKIAKKRCSNFAHDSLFAFWYPPNKIDSMKMRKSGEWDEKTAECTYFLPTW